MKVDQIIIEGYRGLSVVKNGVEFRQYCPFSSASIGLQPCDMQCPLFSPLRKRGGLYFLDICKKTLWSDKVEINFQGFEIREEKDLEENPEEDLELDGED